MNYAISHRLPDGSQGFFVDPSCKNWRREIEDYSIIPGSDFKAAPEHPRHVGDHAMDAHRYAEMGIVRLRWDNPRRRLRAEQATEIPTSFRP